jgi:hypothetical protein
VVLFQWDEVRHGDDDEEFDMQEEYGESEYGSYYDDEGDIDNDILV